MSIGFIQLPNATKTHSAVVKRNAQSCCRIKRQLRALSLMLRFSLVLVALASLGPPATAQQGHNDYPAIIPHALTLLPPKSNEWRAVSHRKDALLSLLRTSRSWCIFLSSSRVRRRRARSRDSPAATT